MPEQHEESNDSKTFSFKGPAWLLVALLGGGGLAGVVNYGGGLLETQRTDEAAIASCEADAADLRAQIRTLRRQLQEERAHATEIEE